MLPKTPAKHTASSNSARKTASRRHQSRILTDKKIADDEFMAAAIGDVEWLKQSLRDAGQNINYDKNGLTAIHLAAIHGRIECLKMCIENFKIDVNLPSTTGWRAVHLCISNQTGKRSMDCLVYLLGKGADSSIANDDGITPVHQAASEGHVQCIKMLMDAGAQLDRRDCRGNTPLDLAKLWGHRKCARLLASEMWHQDKDNVAKEMNLLKKVKTQQVLREIEEDEEMKAAKHYFGDEAFRTWMASKNMKILPTSEYLDTIELRSEDSVGVRPNSVVTHRSKYNAVKAKPEKESDHRRDTLPVHVAQEQEDITENNQADCEMTSEQHTPRKMPPTFTNPVKWNISTKERQTEYVTNLRDIYPRDEYTKMPLGEGMPKFYQGKFVRPVTPNSIDEATKRQVSSSSYRKPKLPDEVINSVLSKDSSRHDRGMLFKCRHIGDIQAKKKYDPETTGRTEIGFHMGDDIKSFSIKNCLAQMSRNSRTSAVDSLALGNSLKQMSKPNRFPNINGTEYLFNINKAK